METERLRQFCVIADTGSLTKAAEILNISLGGLSKSVKVLEQELGFPVFIHAGRGLAVSERGLALYSKARQILDSVSELNREDPAPRSVFRIGLLEVFSIHFIGSLISNKIPTQRVEIIERSPGELEALILAKKIDCGLTYLPFPQASLEILKLGRFELRAFGKPELAKREPEKIPFIVPSTGLDSNPLGIKERDGWPDDTWKRDHFHRTNMLSTALDMARCGLGAVFMPDFAAALHNQTQLKEFNLVPLDTFFKMPRVKREVFLMTRLGAEESLEIKKVAAGVRELLKLAK